MFKIQNHSWISLLIQLEGHELSSKVSVSHNGPLLGIPFVCPILLVLFNMPNLGLNTFYVYPLNLFLGLKECELFSWSKIILLSVQT